MLWILLTVIAALPHANAQTGSGDSTTITLENNQVIAVFDLAGGALFDLSFKDQGLNPLSWGRPDANAPNRTMKGHFICFDRLGQSSPQEKKNGMPGHGEASKVVWEKAAPQESAPPGTTAGMRCELPLARMAVDRTAVLSRKGPVMHVREIFSNLNPLGRICNIVQHPSIGPPFLDSSVLVDSNAWKGFFTGNPVPDVHEPTIYWPHVVRNGELVDLRKMTRNDKPNVSNFICDTGSTHGWMTACNPGKGLMIGYIWDVDDYPWIRHWRLFSGGVPVARGLEFGTTPLPLPFRYVLDIKSIFDTPVYLYLDSRETVEKSYHVFLMKVPEDFQGVDQVEINGNSISLVERENGRSYTVDF